MDKHIPHSFYAGNKVHFSALIEPTSSYAEQLSLKMNDKGYFICNASGIKKLQIKAKALIKSSDTKQYLDFIDNLNKFLKITYLQKNYDDRILEFLKLLSTCDCSNHTISNFADKAALSPSRLSHLFKEQIGIPLKSYILLYQMEQAFKEYILPVP